jgi:hypothetical protein
MKIGGHPNWKKNPVSEVLCTCGLPMHYFATLEGTEFGHARWIANNVPKKQKTGNHLYWAEPTGFLGGIGAINLFICQECNDTPVVGIFQH